VVGVGLGLFVTSCAPVPPLKPVSSPFAVQAKPGVERCLITGNVVLVTDGPSPSRVDVHVVGGLRTPGTGHQGSFTWLDEPLSGAPDRLFQSQTITSVTCELGHGVFADTADITGTLTNGDTFLLSVISSLPSYPRSVDVACLTVTSPTGQTVYNECATQSEHGQPGFQIHLLPSPGPH
jgi:hypothetical protein